MTQQSSANKRVENQNRRKRESERAKTLKQIIWLRILLFLQKGQIIILFL